MKNFLKKYIGLILGIIMLAFFILAAFLYPEQPKLAHVFVDIVAWYISFIITLYLMLAALKISTWFIKKLKKFNRHGIHDK
jgi:uncharacterized membrane protein